MKSLRLNRCQHLTIYTANVNHSLRRPILPFVISAGFPSPALDFTEVSIDLNKQLIDHPSATFYGRVQGESMKNAGINDGDLLIIDKSITPEHGKIAVCYLNGEFTLKRICIKNEELWLMPENEAYAPIKVDEMNDFTVWGIVTYVIKKTV